MALDYLAIEALAPVLVAASCIATAGWVFNNWLRMRHRYPLENSWGKILYPKGDSLRLARGEVTTQ